MEGISRLQNTARYIKMKERGIKQNEEEKNCNIVVSTDALYKHFVCRDRRKCGGDFAGGAGNAPE